MTARERQTARPNRGNEPVFAITQQDLGNGLLYLRTAAFTISEDDIRVWQLCTNVCAISNEWAYVCLALNVLLPGTGTMLCGCLGDKNMNKTQVILGMFQLMTAVFLVGWIVSIYWGYLIVEKSEGGH